MHFPGDSGGDADDFTAIVDQRGPAVAFVDRRPCRQHPRSLRQLPPAAKVALAQRLNLSNVPRRPNPKRFTIVTVADDVDALSRPSVLFRQAQRLHTGRKRGQLDQCQIAGPIASQHAAAQRLPHLPQSRQVLDVPRTFGADAAGVLRRARKNHFDRFIFADDVIVGDEPAA